MFSHLTRPGGAFANTANPQSLFLSHTHASALSVLSDVPEEGRNIRVLIGEPGMGKTMLLVRLLEQFKSSALTAHLFWTRLVGDEFLRYFLHELGVLPPPGDTGPARKLFSAVLEREFGRGRKVIVAIDEAHNLELPTLRGLGEVLDSSLARSRDLEIVFAGLPHLTAKLASTEAREISTRISAIASLAPLSFEETTPYINHRLRISGHQGPAPFTADALATIAKLAEGIPCNINNVCNTAIYLAEQRVCNVINSDIVLEAAAQRERRLIRQESAPESIALPPDVAAVEAVANQQMSVASQQHVSTRAPTDNATCLGETFAEKTLVKQEVAGVPDSIRQRFGEHGLASSGTVEELAAVGDRPESELVHAVQTAMSFYEAVGRTPPVSLRRLQEAKETVTEETNTRPRLPEQRVNECEAGDSAASKDALMQDIASPCHSGVGANCEAHNHKERTETVFVSPADQALDQLREISVFQAVDEAPSSRLRLVVPALVLALLVGLGWTYAMRPAGRTYFLRIGRQLARAKVASKGIIFLREKPQPLAGATNAPTVSSRKEPLATDKAVASQEGQSSSGIEILQANGIQPHTGQISKSFQQAALSGDANAQFELGTAYALGRGVPADPVIGYTWLTLAFANGDRQAESSIRQLTQQLSQSQIAQIRWNVGEMYANGVGVQPDKVAAYMWHVLGELAGEKRSTIARSNLAATMTSGERSEASARASQWLKRHHK